MATFNAEFLIPSKVHVKYGLRFNIGDKSQAEQDEWEVPVFRTLKFEEAVERVAGLLATVETDVLVLTEVGNEEDVDALVQQIAAHGVNYDHVAVCDCSDNYTQQHVAILSKIPFVSGSIISSIPGREAYILEPDDADEQDDTGVSKGMRVSIDVDNQLVHIYAVHLASERGGHDKDQQRIAQASIVRRHSIPALNAGEHVIVAGDLNDRRGQPTLKRIRGLDDIWPFFDTNGALVLL